MSYMRMVLLTDGRQELPCELAVKYSSFRPDQHSTPLAYCFILGPMFLGRVETRWSICYKVLLMRETVVPTIKLGKIVVCP